MPGYNRVVLEGRLGRDPECKVFSNGGKVAQFSIAVPGKRVKDDSGNWSEEACWVDVKCFNSEKGRKLADTAESYLRKGKEVLIEGHLILEKWVADGQNRQRLVVHADAVIFVGPKDEGSPGPSRERQQEVVGDIIVPF